MTNYIIEKMDVKKNEWQRVNSYCRVPFYEVIGLDQDHQYKFRILAENAQGQSVPLESEQPIVAKNPYEKPGAPAGLQVVAQTPDEVTLEWQPPADNGGAKIAGYCVEIKDADSDEWFPVNDTLLRGNSFTVSKLMPGAQYAFRVKAKNAAGWGQPSRGQLDVQLKPECVRPDAPGVPEIQKIGFVVLSLSS